MIEKLLDVAVAFPFFVLFGDSFFSCPLQLVLLPFSFSSYPVAGDDDLVGRSIPHFLLFPVGRLLPPVSTVLGSGVFFFFVFFFFFLCEDASAAVTPPFDAS